MVQLTKACAKNGFKTVVDINFHDWLKLHTSQLSHLMMMNFNEFSSLGNNLKTKHSKIIAVLNESRRMRKTDQHRESQRDKSFSCPFELAQICVWDKDLRVANSSSNQTWNVKSNFHRKTLTTSQTAKHWVQTLKVKKYRSGKLGSF